MAHSITIQTKNLPASLREEIEDKEPKSGAVVTLLEELATRREEALTDDTSELRREMDRLETENSNHQQRMVVLEREVANATKHNEALQGRISNLKSVHNAEIYALREELDALEAALGNALDLVTFYRNKTKEG